MTPTTKQPPSCETLFPTYQTVLCLMELRAALENRYFFVDIRYEAMPNIEATMFISEEFLQNITYFDGTFQKATQPCLESAARIRDLAEMSARDHPIRIAKLKRLRASQLKTMNLLQGSWEDLLQMARDYDESVTIRGLSAMIDFTVAVDDFKTRTKHGPRRNFRADGTTLYV